MSELLVCFLPASPSNPDLSLFSAGHSLMGNSAFRSPPTPHTPHTEPHGQLPPWGTALCLQETASTRSQDAREAPDSAFSYAHGETEAWHREGCCSSYTEYICCGQGHIPQLWSQCARSSQLFNSFRLNQIHLATSAQQAMRLPWMQLSCQANPEHHSSPHHTAHGQELFCTQIWPKGADRIASLTEATFLGFCNHSISCHYRILFLTLTMGQPEGRL